MMVLAPVLQLCMAISSMSATSVSLAHPATYLAGQPVGVGLGGWVKAQLEGVVPVTHVTLACSMKTATQDQPS